MEPKEEIQQISVSEYTRLISAIEQDGKIIVYGLVDSEYPESLGKRSKKLYVVGTGWKFDLNGLFVTNFIVTVKVREFVWHIFEVDEVPF